LSWRFQSLIGELKTFKELPDYTKPSKFQSLIGELKTLLEQIGIEELILFQSLIGELKTGKEVELDQAPIIGFNPS